MADASDIFRQVQAATDIVAIIGEHIQLHRAGREMKCLCPFHDDRRPSMSVVPHKQIFWCFVCQTGGDVFKFVQLYHKMTPGESLRFLAERAGIKLPDRPGYSPEKKGAREQIIETNEKACAYFEKILRSEPGKEGLAYFHGRGLKDETLAEFRLGMSADKWTGLVDAAAKAGVTYDQLKRAGLSKERRDGSPYDAFRNRVIFPIFDGTSKCIAFGGRVLVEKRDESGTVVEAKYLNSPETDVFKKNATLYGLHLAKRAIMDSSTAVIVEGYMDVIACHQAGVKNVVATLGTALTPEHARQLRHYCQTVVLIFDSDDAGRRAADRALDLFVREPLDVKIASVPNGKDPCDFCMANGEGGGEAFQKIIDTATDAMTFQWKRLLADFKGTDSVVAKTEAGKRFMDFVRAAVESRPDELDMVRRGVLASKIAGLLGLPIEDVTRDLAKRSGGRGLVGSPGAQFSPRPVQEVPRAAQAPGSNGIARAEAWVLGSLLTEPQLYDKVREDLTLDLFSPDHYRDLASRLIEYLDNATELADCSLGGFMNEIQERALMQQAIDVQEAGEAGGKVEQKLLDGLKNLRESWRGGETDDQLDENQLQKRLEEIKKRATGGGDPRKKGIQPQF